MEALEDGLEEAGHAIEDVTGLDLDGDGQAVCVCRTFRARNRRPEKRERG